MLEDPEDHDLVKKAAKKKHSASGIGMNPIDLTIKTNCSEGIGDEHTATQTESSAAPGDKSRTISELEANTTNLLRAAVKELRDAIENFRDHNCFDQTLKDTNKFGNTSRLDSIQKTNEETEELMQTKMRMHCMEIQFVPRAKRPIYARPSLEAIPEHNLQDEKDSSLGFRHNDKSTNENPNTTKGFRGNQLNTRKASSSDGTKSKSRSISENRSRELTVQPQPGFGAVT